MLPVERGHVAINHAASAIGPPSQRGRRRDEHTSLLAPDRDEFDESCAFKAASSAFFALLVPNIVLISVVSPAVALGDGGEDGTTVPVSQCSNLAVVLSFNAAVALEFGLSFAAGFCLRARRPAFLFAYMALASALLVLGAFVKLVYTERNADNRPCISANGEIFVWCGAYSPVPLLYACAFFRALRSRWPNDDLDDPPF